MNDIIKLDSKLLTFTELTKGTIPFLRINLTYFKEMLAFIVTTILAYCIGGHNFLHN